MNKTKVLVCGLGWTGSSAVIDLLQEFEPVHVVPNEFDDIRKVDGFSDFADGRITTRKFFKANFKSTIVKPIKKSILKPFKSKKNRKKTIKETYYFWMLFFRIARKQHNNQINFKWYIDKISSTHKNLIAFDQPIFIEDERTDLSIFGDTKIIFVIRDPFVQMKDISNVSALFNVEHKTAFAYGMDRNNPRPLYLIADTVKQRYMKLKELLSDRDKDILILDFNSLVNEYDKSVDIISTFLKLDTSAHTLKKKHFNPEISKNNLTIKNYGLNDVDERRFDELNAIYRELLSNSTH